ELSALLTACLWSGGALAFAAATKRAGSFQVNITRLILAAVYLVLLILIAGLNVNLSNTQILMLSLSGVVGLTFGDTFLFKAFYEIGARVTMLIMSIAPAIAALLAYLILGETLSTAGILGIAITILGVSIVVTDRGGTGTEKVVLTTSGIVFAMLAAVGQGSGLVFAKMAFEEGEVNGFVATAVRIIASLVFLLPVALMTKRYHNPVRMYKEDKRAFMLTALGSVLGPFLGISFSLIAIEHTKVGIAATIMALVPILMLPLVRIIYKEKLAWRAVLGAFTAVAGVAVLFLR
ncbi:MAG: putative permease super family, partial [Bacteroidetes bacterium]|nr:putative permease super family [Bacteroidota bacterium]